MARERAKFYAGIRRIGKRFQGRFQIRDAASELPVLTSDTERFDTWKETLDWMQERAHMRGLRTVIIEPRWSETTPPRIGKKLKRSGPNRFILRPGITNPELWYPTRPPRSKWNRIRNFVLERDNYTCFTCGHRALRYMNVHHQEGSTDNKPANLVTTCVACHAVLHIGKNLALNVIQIWKSQLSQVEIVQRTRDGIRMGLPLSQINKSFKLKRGWYPPDSRFYASDLVHSMRAAPRAYLAEPLCAVFVKLKRWQLE